MAQPRSIDRAREIMMANLPGVLLAAALVIAVVAWMVFSIGGTPSGIPT